MTRFLFIALIALTLQHAQAVEPMELSESQNYITQTNFNQFNDWTGNILFALGNHNLNGSDWDPVDDLDNTGFLIDIGKKEWPIHLSLDYFTSDASGSAGGTDSDLEISEIDFGIRYIIDIPHRMPTIYSGFGLAYVEAEMSQQTGVVTVSDDESSLGFFLCVGGYAKFQNHFLVGLDLRYTDAGMTLFGTPAANAGGWRASALLGLRW